MEWAPKIPLGCGSSHNLEFLDYISAIAENIREQLEKAALFLFTCCDIWSVILSKREHPLALRRLYEYRRQI